MFTRRNCGRYQPFQMFSACNEIKLERSQRGHSEVTAVRLPRSTFITKIDMISVKVCVAKPALKFLYRNNFGPLHLLLYSKFVSSSFEFPKSG
jgi:hypothetical protein